MWFPHPTIPKQLYSKDARTFIPQVYELRQGRGLLVTEKDALSSQLSCTSQNDNTLYEQVQNLPSYSQTQLIRTLLIRHFRLVRHYLLDTLH